MRPRRRGQRAELAAEPGRCCRSPACGRSPAAIAEAKQSVRGAGSPSMVTACKAGLCSPALFSWSPRVLRRAMVGGNILGRAKWSRTCGLPGHIMYPHVVPGL